MKRVLAAVINLAVMFGPATAMALWGVDHLPHWFLSIAVDPSSAKFGAVMLTFSASCLVMLLVSWRAEKGGKGGYIHGPEARRYFLWRIGYVVMLVAVVLVLGQSLPHWWDWWLSGCWEWFRFVAGVIASGVVVTFLLTLVALKTGNERLVPMFFDWDEVQRVCIFLGYLLAVTIAAFLVRGLLPGLWRHWLPDLWEWLRVVLAVGSLMLVAGAVMTIVDALSRSERFQAWLAGPVGIWKLVGSVMYWAAAIGLLFWVRSYRPGLWGYWSPNLDEWLRVVLALIVIGIPAFGLAALAAGFLLRIPWYALLRPLAVAAGISVLVALLVVKGGGLAQVARAFWVPAVAVLCAALIVGGLLVALWQGLSRPQRVRRFGEFYTSNALVRALLVVFVFLGLFSLLRLEGPRSVKDFPPWFFPGYSFWTRAVLGIVCGWLVLTVFGGLWVRLEEFLGLYDPFANTGRRRPLVISALVAMREWWEIFSRFGRGATSAWASLLEVLSLRYRDGTIFLGRPRLFIGGLLRPIGLSAQKHFLTIAGTGSGKSTAALIPNLCIYKGSLVCIDPKGELASITAARRGQGGNGVRGMGQKVFILDPFGDVKGIKTSCYNVFDEMARMAEIDPDRPVTYAGLIGRALVRPYGGKDAYFDDAARTLIKGIALYVLRQPPEKRNLVQLRRYLMQGDVEAHAALPREAQGQYTPFDVLMRKMKEGLGTKSIVDEAMAGAAISVEAMAGNQMGAVLTTAQEQTTFLDTPEIRRVSMRSDFLLQDITTKTMSIYVCLPLVNVVGDEGRWLRMFVILLLDVMGHVDRAPKPPVLLAIDEFPNLGRLDGIETVAPSMRSKGLRFWAIGQDVKQFAKEYPLTWDGFFGGAQAIQFLGVTEINTREYIAKELGRHIAVGWRRVGDSKVATAEERPLLDPEQIGRFLSPKRKNQIVLRLDERPILLKMTPYFKYLPWWYYSPDRHNLPEKWKRRLWRRLDPTPPTPPPAPAPVLSSKPPDFRLGDLKSPLNWGELKLPPLNWGELPGGKKEDAPATDIRRDERPQTAEEEKPETKAATSGWFNRLKEAARPEADSDDEDEGEEEEDFDRDFPELRGVIGLNSVKAQIRKTFNLVKFAKRRQAIGLRPVEISHHMVFTGNPGTGKTMMARAVGAIYKRIGLLAKGEMIECDRGALVGEYIGHTQPKTQAVIDRALDGILFIDEAYTLVPKELGDRDFGPEALQTLLLAMENYRSRLVVIVAGYKTEMGRFMAGNPGLSSRFKNYIDFPDYTAEEMTVIFRSIAAGEGFRVSPDALVKVAALMASLERGEHFGNARAVRNIFDECVARLAGRWGKYGRKVDMSIFEADDIPTKEEIAHLSFE
jgi:stage V sporulation protein K